MSAGPLTLELLTVFVLTVCVLHKYGNWRKQHFIVTFSTLIGWYLAFIIVFILPMDVALCYYRNCLETYEADSTHTNATRTNVTVLHAHYQPAAETHEIHPRALEQIPNGYSQVALVFIIFPLANFDTNATSAERSSSSVATRGEASHVTLGGAAQATEHVTLAPTQQSLASKFCIQPGSYVPAEVLLDFWILVYWTSQVLTWLILPLMQSYSNAGDFTALAKIRTALYENAIFYGSYLLIFGVLLIYCASKGISLSPENLKVICITASNTWGLFLLVFLMGYGLVEVPRQLWQLGNKGYRLQKIYFDIEKLSAEKNDAEENVRESFRDAQSALDSLRDGNALKTHAQTIMDKFPHEISSKLRRRETRAGGDSFRDTDAANLTATTEKQLVRLHKRVIECLQSHHRTQAQWSDLVDNALHLEEVAKNENNPRHQREFKRTYRKDQGLIESMICIPSVEWYWECVIKRPLLKALAVVLVMFTLFIVWSECTFFSVHPTLSLAAVFVNSAARHYEYFYIELSSILVIAYMCVCAYYTVFKIRIYRYYHLDHHHQTDENSLLFSAILLCRLTPPLCLNFLSMIHLDSHVVRSLGRTVKTETAYTAIMGHMDLIGVISNGFNVYFPIAILLLCLGTYFRLGTRCLHYIGIDQFVGDDEMTTELVAGGKALVQNERNRLVRESNREARQEFWQDKLQGHDSSRPLRRNFGGSSSAAAAPSAVPSYSDSGRIDSGRSFRPDRSAHPAGAVREYSDAEPIVPEMEENETAGAWQTPGGASRRDYGSPGDAPRGIFDDL